jgi:signal transduction histidine kinase
LSPTLEASERLRRTERVISFLRLGIVGFNVLTYQWLAPNSSRHALANVICVVATLYAVATVVHRPPAERSFAVAVANMLLDYVFIALWIYATDSFASPFYPLFYAEAAASIGRFGILWGNASGAFGGLLYVFVVGLDGFEGKGYQLAVRIVYIFFIGGFVSHVVNLARRSEREVAKAEREAAMYMELDGLRSTFVTNISHELRTPLTAIRGASATLARRDVSPPQQRALIEMIDRQSARLSGLVQDIIDIGLGEQGKLIPHFSAVDIVDLTSEVVEGVRVETERQVEFLRPEGFARALCDGSKIANALHKLLDNAIKFSPHGSTVRVELEHDDEWVSISVSDEGMGISPDEVENIFEQFHQGDPSMTRATGGTGIGLSIVRTILELHGGRVDVSSTPGAGSRFTLTFPKMTSELERGAASAPLRDSPSV